MRACDQSVGEFNEAQYQLYCNLISEEFNELVASDNKVDDLDALIDILVVTIGAIHSLGADAQGIEACGLDTTRSCSTPAKR